MRLFAYASRPLFQQARTLHKFSRPRSEVVIGSNTALFATLASLAKHGKAMHPDVTVFCPKFWMDSIHDDYLQEDWGQTIYGLPKVARELFLKLYPLFGDMDYIKWGQIKRLREEALDILITRYKVPVYFGEPVIEKLPDNSFRIEVIDNHGRQYWLNKSSDTWFYLCYNVPRKHPLAGIIQRPSTELYQKSRSSLPDDVDLVVLGASLSTVWIAKHFASSSRNIICLKRKADEINMTLPVNRDLDYSKIIPVNLEESSISLVNDDPFNPRVIVSRTMI